MICQNVFIHIADCDSLENLKSVLHESILMKKFDHPNVLPIFGVCLENNLENGLPFIVLPFMANGDLKSYLTDIRKKSKLLIVNQLPEVQLNNLSLQWIKINVILLCMCICIFNNVMQICLHTKDLKIPTVFFICYSTVSITNYIASQKCILLFITHMSLGLKAK